MHPSRRHRRFARGLALLALACAACAAPLCAQTRDASPDPIPFERGLDKLRCEVLAAQSGLCALSVAAHPDDEDGPTLAWLRRIAGIETHICLATRGEGGQNESGPELGMKLAALRSDESEAAARIYGAQVWYLNLPDFGYSKSKAETFEFWGKEVALERLVRVIRTVKPDIVFTNHNPGGTDHGHHQATGELVFEAYEAAADAKRFPEHMKDGLSPWQVAKIYRRVPAAKGATVSLEVSQSDPSSGYAPTEIAAWALSRHVSQGMRREVAAGEREYRHFLLEKSILPEVEEERSLTDGLGDLPPLSEDAAALKQALGPDPTARARELLGWYAAVDRQFMLKIKRTPAQLAHLQRRRQHLAIAVQEALGVRIEPNPDDPVVTPGQKTTIDLRIANTGPLTVTVRGVRAVAEAHWDTPVPKLEAVPLASGQHQNLTLIATPRDSLKAAERPVPTWPVVSYMTERNRRAVPLRYALTVEAGETSVALSPTEVPLNLAPAFEARLTPDPVLLFDDPDREDKGVLACAARLEVTSFRAGPWTLYAKLADDPRFVGKMEAPLNFEFTREGQTLSHELRFTAQVKHFDQGDFEAQTILWTQENRFAHPPVARFRRVGLKLPDRLHVGVVKTYDRATLDALHTMYESLRRRHGERIGYVQELSAEDLRTAKLDALETIILDLRATQYRPDVLQYRERLHAYMREGGHVVCLYHKDFDWNKPDDLARGRGFFRGNGGGEKIAPYPIRLSFNRVTDETAEVSMLKEAHPLLSKPCRIWARDFTGWVQERGVYFPDQWGPEYTSLLRSHDKGEEPLDGGLLVAPVGQGSFVYTSYVWYRQLRAGHPGAYRMLANLISYPRVKD